MKRRWSPSAGHRHAVGDKLYYVLSGTGRIRVGADERDVRAGDLVCAPAGDEHAVRNPGPGRLTLLVVMAHVSEVAEPLR